MRVAALRGGALLVNVAGFGAAPLIFGAPWWSAALFAALCFYGSWRFALRAPQGESAEPVLVSTSRRLAERAGIDHPRFVRRVPGWTAGAVRCAGGYGLVLGDEVDAAHAEAILAHELAHVALGDLSWEPWTDGVARALTPAVRKLPPLWLILFPFFVLGVPLARTTELRADDFAAALVSSYPLVLKEVAAKLGSREAILYPSLQVRFRRSARRSMRIQE